MTRHLAFLFSLEAAFSLTLAIIAASYLFAFAPQQEGAGASLACSDAARVLAQSHAFSSQERLDAAVFEAGALLRMCVEATDDGGLEASSCGRGALGAGDGKGRRAGGEGGEAISFSFPAWSGGKLRSARVSCRQAE